MRVAVVAGPAPGHAFPAAALGLALHRRGHLVRVVTGIDWLAALRRDGLAAEHLPLLTADPRDRDFGFRLWGRAAEMAPAIAANLAGFRPDALVVDTLTVGGAFAAALLGRPWVELIPHPLQDVSRSLPAPGTGLTPGRTVAGRARDALTRRLHLRSLARAAGERAAARQRLGLPGDCRPVGRLVATLPGLELPRPDWPPRTEVVGPLEWDPESRELPAPVGDGPLVFLSASTAPTGAGGLLPLTLTACADLGARLACTQFAAYPDRLPAWAVVGPGRQAPLLDRAAVVVAGGGHGMVAKALVRGLPLLTVPGGGEQYDNAMRVRRLGAGVAILPGRLNPARLTRALSRLLGERSFAAASRRVGATGRGLGPEQAARTVERMLG